MAEFEALSGLAGEIRATLDSEQYDLGGYTEQRARDLLVAAFSKPLSAPKHMVKFTFVVGGGKLVRSRYNDDLTKWMTATLREIGYVEDKSAAETFDSQGTYKQQHDTGQNLKYLIVYPRVTCSEVSADVKDEAKSVLDTTSQEYAIVASPFDIFKNIVSTKVFAWRQKKRVLKILTEGIEEFKTIEAKLISGSPLTAREQAAYEANSGQDVEKLAWLQAEIKTMVDEGKLTVSEKEELVHSLVGNIEAVSAEIVNAIAENDTKKAEKLEEKKSNIVARKSAIEKAPPFFARLKHGEEIQKLRVRLLPLIALEERGRSVSLTLADLKTLEEKSEIEAAISQLEGASRGWYETDEDFELKCKFEIREAKAKYDAKVKAQKAKKPSKGVVSGSQGRGSSSSNAWTSVPTKGHASRIASSSKSTGGGFAAAFGDSDSD